MEHGYALRKLNVIIRQRNIGFIFVVIMLLSNLCLSISYITMKRELIMVPGIMHEYRIVGNKVSNSYLEEMTHMFLSCLLDLTPENIAYKKELVLKYTVAGSVKGINKYFARAQEQHDKFKFSTYFSVKHLEIFPEKMEVIAVGILNSRFGKNGAIEVETEYSLKYQMLGGLLRLKSFALINREEQKN